MHQATYSFKGVSKLTLFSLVLKYVFQNCHPTVRYHQNNDANFSCFGWFGFRWFDGFYSRGTSFGNIESTLLFVVVAFEIPPRHLLGSFIFYSLRKYDDYMDSL